MKAEVKILVPAVAVPGIIEVSKNGGRYDLGRAFALEQLQLLQGGIRVSSDLLEKVLDSLLAGEYKEERFYTTVVVEL